MKILLDECIPRKFKRCLPGHHCLTVAEVGFSGNKNGILLDLARRAGFEVLLTLDQGLPYEQNLSEREISILLLCARSNRLTDLEVLVAPCLLALQSIQPGQLMRVVP